MPADVHADRTAAWSRRERFHGKDAILSGPAGGVVGMVRTAELAGFDQIIGFDMGGTSTDVSPLRRRATSGPSRPWWPGVRMRAPMMQIHTVAAGGGSICVSTAAGFASVPIPPAPILVRPVIGAAGRSP